MALYNISGQAVNAVYNIDGDGISEAYDIDGNEVFSEIPDIPVTPKTWSMSDNYKSQITNALDYISTYKRQNPNSYALCQFNDVHNQFSGNEPNFIDYNKGYKVIDYMMFLGDIVNGANATQYANAIDYMSGASASKKLIAMGNHEYSSYSSSAGNPETLYGALINVDCTYKESDILIYYHDNTNKNVRFIALDYFYQTKTSADNGHLLDLAQLEWLATVLENSGSKDIVLIAHSMLNPFLALESNQTLSSSATLQNYDKLIDLIVAFTERGTYTVTVSGVSYSHDFSECTGDFVMYTTGHYHALGYGDFGFNMFTCPTLGTTYGGSHKGFVFYIINKTTKAIKVIQCSSELNDYIDFDYSY